MQNLLNNPGFFSLLGAIVSTIIAPLFFERIKKYGEEQKKKFEETAEKQRVQLEETTRKIDNQNIKLDEITEKLELQDKAMIGTIRYELIKAMSEAIKRKYTTTKEVEDIHDLLDPYKEMGGNGTVDTMYKKFRELEIDGSKGEIL